MKKSQKGFVVPLLIGIIVLLVIGGSVYIYENEKVKVSAVVDSTTAQSNQALKPAIQNNPISPLTNTSSWKKYSDASISFEYPILLSLKKEGESVTLSHSISYKHPDFCDFKGNASPLERLSDFYISITVFNKNLKDLIQSTQYPGWDYVSKNPFKSGSFDGYKVDESIEGCGENVYYFAISPTKTLVINRPITEFNQGISILPGIIDPKHAEEFFTKILSSIKVVGQTPQIDTQQIPTVTILSPNGGEVLKIGDTHTITWRSSSPFVNIELITRKPCALVPCLTPPPPGYTGKTPTPLKAEISSRTPRDSKRFNWSAGTYNYGERPTLAPPGEYKIKICDITITDPLICDISDDYFSITN